jgi:hypothetical protein
MQSHSVRSVDGAYSIRKVDMLTSFIQLQDLPQEAAESFDNIDVVARGGL